MYPYISKEAYEIDEYDKAFYADICEHFEEERICKPEDYTTPEEYAIIAASIAIDDKIMGFEHYEKFQAYARAYHRNKTIKIEIA